MNTRSPVALMFVATMVLGGGTLMSGSDTDSRIEAAARDTHVYRTYLKDDSIKIEAKDGVVVLTGTVSAESHKTLAQDTVEGLPGVKRVDNRLEVTGDKAEENSDVWILTKVKTSLWFHRSVSSLTEVDVKDGCVTLRGTASTLAEKDLTTEYARDVDGVKEVKNEMTVVKDGAAKDTATSSEKIDDASINAQVRMALASHRSTSALHSRPVTRDGVVTLSGEAASQAQKDLASKITRDIDGVKSVTNTMTVKA